MRAEWLRISETGRCDIFFPNQHTQKVTQSTFYEYLKKKKNYNALLFYFLTCNLKKMLIKRKMTSITISTKHGMKCFTSFHFSSIKAVGGKHSSQRVSSVSSFSDGKNLRNLELKKCEKKLCSPLPSSYVFGFFHFSFKKLASSHLSENNNNNSNYNNNHLRYELPLPLFLRFLSLFKLSAPPPPPSPLCLRLSASLLLVVAKLNGQPVADAAERGGLNLPVVDRVSKQADAVIEGPLHPESARAEVIHSHLVDVVGMKVYDLKNREGDIEG